MNTTTCNNLAMKKDLHKDFAALCNVHVPSGDFLFGDLSKAELQNLSKFPPGKI
jgi:hypothetical protein